MTDLFSLPSRRLLSLTTCLVALATATWAFLQPPDGIAAGNESSSERISVATAAAVDESACPTAGTAAELAADPLVGPEAEDDLTEATLAEPVAPAGAAGDDMNGGSARPNADLEPAVRAPNSATSAVAAQDADAPGVHVGLIRWCVVQPTSARTYDWSAYDAVMNPYMNQGEQGVPILSLKVVDAPKWAVYPGCVDLAQQGRVKKCPPQADAGGDLWAFGKALAEHYGPSDVAGTGYTIPRVSFWNEPNLPDNWGDPTAGGVSEQRGRAARYSDRLTEFSRGAVAGDGAIKVDAGEVAAGGTQEKGNGVRVWAKYFSDYTAEKERGDTFDQFTIHAYSEVATQVVKKVNSYRALPRIAAVGVSEFGWAVGSGGWKCAASQEEQRTKFNNVVDDVTGSEVAVGRLVWFNLLDNRKGDGTKCPDNSAHYDSAVRSTQNTFGLYKADSNGGLQSFSPSTHSRLLAAAFRNAQN